MPGRRSATVGRRIGAEAHRLLLPQSVHRPGGIVADLLAGALAQRAQVELAVGVLDQYLEQHGLRAFAPAAARGQPADDVADMVQPVAPLRLRTQVRSEEHTSQLQSLMRISSALS